MKTKIVRINRTIISLGEMTIEVPETATLKEIEQACWDECIEDQIEWNLDDSFEMRVHEKRTEVEPALEECAIHLSLEDEEYKEALIESGILV